VKTPLLATTLLTFSLIASTQSADGVLEEIGVSWNIHKGYGEPGSAVKGRQSRFNGKAPALSLIESVCVDPGKGADQRSFTVVDLAGYSNRDIFFHNPQHTKLMEGARGIEPSPGFADRHNGFEVRVACQHHCPHPLFLKGR
jgi:hypothetical protein